MSRDSCARCPELRHPLGHRLNPKAEPWCSVFAQVIGMSPHSRLEGRHPRVIAGGRHAHAASSARPRHVERFGPGTPTRTRTRTGPSTPRATDRCRPALSRIFRNFGERHHGALTLFGWPTFNRAAVRTPHQPAAACLDERPARLAPPRGRWPRREADRVRSTRRAVRRVLAPPTLDHPAFRATRLTAHRWTR